MKWGYASTAAIVRSLQKDLYYRQELEKDLKLILLDHLNVGIYLKIEEWLPLLTDLAYYFILTGAGRRTLGEAYSNIVPVDLDKRDFFLKSKVKRVIWIVCSVLLPFTLKKRCKSARLKRLIDCLAPLNSIFFYYSGAFPSIINRFLAVRYIFYPQRPPMLDADSWIYKGLALATGILAFNNLREAFITHNPSIITSNTKSLMKPCRQQYKCPVCLDPIAGLSFASIKCGHVYCWHCISKWMILEREAEMQESWCPVCRVACNPPDLLPLANLK